MLKKEKLYRFFFISLNEFLSFAVSIWARTMVTCYVTKISATCLAIIDASHRTIRLLLRDKSVVVSILLITRSLESVGNWFEPP